MTTQQQPAQVEPEYPGVGDLVVHGDGDYRYVVSNIVGLKSDDPQWDMRPVHGGGSIVVRKDTIEEWKIRARRGKWAR